MLNPRARGMAALLTTAAIVWLLSPPAARAATVNFAATIDGAQEVPPNLSTSTGTGTFVMDTELNTLSYNITYTPLATTETAAHIHGYSGLGVSSLPQHTLPPANPKVGVWDYPAANEAMIIDGLTYVNIHSMAFSNGEIRGQILRVPSCGDTVVDGPGEQCDDGNNSNGDGCDSLCQTEPPGPNHYLCRQVKDLKVPAKFVAVTGITVVDQTGADTCEAKKPFLLCDPVDKNGGGIDDPSLHYCCYKLKCGLKPEVNYEVTDQFWNGTISTKKPKFLCNPCMKAPAP